MERAAIHQPKLITAWDVFKVLWLVILSIFIAFLMLMHTININCWKRQLRINEKLINQSNEQPEKLPGSFKGPLDEIKM